MVYSYITHATTPWEQGNREPEDPYEVLVLHREFDNKCIIRLRGFDNLVFWKEIKLNRPFAWKRIQDAKDKANKKADQLRKRDEGAKHTFELSKGKL